MSKNASYVIEGVGTLVMKGNSSIGADSMAHITNVTHANIENNILISNEALKVIFLLQDQIKQLMDSDIEQPMLLKLTELEKNLEAVSKGDSRTFIDSLGALTSIGADVAVIAPAIGDMVSRLLELLR